MNRLFASFAGPLLLAGPMLAQPVVNAVVNAASYDPAVSRGSLISIFGTRLARSTVSAASLPLPRRLEDTVVRVGDVELEAPLYSVSPAQINAQLPFEVLGERVAVIVTTAEGRSSPFLLTPVASGPGIFTRNSDGKGRALVFNPGFQPNDTVAPGEPLILYATGLGPTDPPTFSGSPGASAEPFNRAVSLPEILVGDFPAELAFAGLAPGLAGVYQLNVIPQAVGTDRLFVRSRGRLSNMTEIGLRAGQNVTNASGAIQAVYPTAQTTGTPSEPFGLDVVGFSPHLVVSGFTARVEIAPAAGPFVIAAITEGLGSSLISVDPGNGSFEGLVSVPTARSRLGDFSGTEVAPLDLLTCHRVGAELRVFPFPGSRIPLSRLSPLEVRALRTLPLPNIDVAGNSTGLLRIRGTARPGSTFLIDQENNSALSSFAGYVPVRSLCTRNQTTTMKLFIDGRLVASTELRYLAGGFPE